MNILLNPTTIDARLAQLLDLFGPPPVLSSENLKPITRCCAASSNASSRKISLRRC